MSDYVLNNRVVEKNNNIKEQEITLLGWINDWL